MPVIDWISIYEMRRSKAPSHKDKFSSSYFQKDIPDPPRAGNG